MTREEAIRIIETVFQDEYVYKYYDSITHQALDMAIEALEAKTDGDLISRQGALAKIRTRLQDWAAYGNEEYRRGLYACEDMILSLPSAEASQDLAEPNKELKGSDLIRRADAIDAVWKIVPVETEIDSTLLDKAEVIVELSVLPSAEAVQGWIPCSERLPDERQDVYVTVLWDDYGNYITAYGMRTRFGWHLHSNAEGELIKGYTVIAWMPLPEPYREDGEI